jgi:hypothetical protein
MTILSSPLYNKITSPFYGIFLLCFFYTFHPQKTFAQAPGMLEFAGRTLKDGKPLSGATVTVYRNGSIQQEQIKTGKNGKFDFNLVFGVDYKVTFSNPGCSEMYLLVYTSMLPKTRSGLYPLYQTEIPFFETTNPGVRVSKFKNPLTKIIYDGKKAFVDDEAYLAQFTKDLVIDPTEQAKLLAEKEAAEKAKRVAAEKLRLDLENKLLADAKAKQDSIDKVAELVRMKLEASNKKEPTNQTLENQVIRLQQEKEAKNSIAKKNKEIKTNFENNLLKMVAENERQFKQKAFNKEKQEARANTVITQMRIEADIKAQSNKVREEQKLKQNKMLANQQYKSNEIRKLVEAAAFAERSVRISKQKTLPDVKGYIKKALPNFAVTSDEGIIKTVRTTVVTQGKKMDNYRKETYFWGTTIFYKNNREIDETTYNTEVAYFCCYKDE